MAAPKDDNSTMHTPATRVDMYRELAEDKAEKDAREKERLPKERDADKEQKEALERTRKLENEGRIRQCNEGKWDFRLDEYAKSDAVTLDVSVPKHLDSSLIDVDIHPEYVSVIIKSKVLRLTLPAEVKVDESKAQRSKTTGHLVLTMPKVNPSLNSVGKRLDSRAKKAAEDSKQTEITVKETRRRERHLSHQLQQDATAHNRAGEESMREVRTTLKGPLARSSKEPVLPEEPALSLLDEAGGDRQMVTAKEEDDDEPPPLF